MVSRQMPTQCKRKVRTYLPRDSCSRHLVIKTSQKVLHDRDMTEEDRLEYCRSVLAEQQASDLTVRRRCKKNGMTRARFYRYKKFVEAAATETKTCAEESGAAREVQTITIESDGARILVEEMPE